LNHRRELSGVILPGVRLRISILIFH
jgi:hypothetical protein